MLVKRTEIGSRNVLADGQIQVRVDTIFEENGVEVNRTYHRKVLAPGDDLTKEDASVALVAKAVWTPAVIATHKAKAAK